MSDGAPGEEEEPEERPLDHHWGGDDEEGYGVGARVRVGVGDADVTVGAATVAEAKELLDAAVVAVGRLRTQIQ